MVIQYTRQILPKMLVIGSTIYSYTFFKEINWDDSFMSQKSVSINFFTDTLSGTFFFTIESVCFTFHGLFF